MVAMLPKINAIEFSSVVYLPNGRQVPVNVITNSDGNVAIEFTDVPTADLIAEGAIDREMLGLTIGLMRVLPDGRKD